VKRCGVDGGRDPGEGLISAATSPAKLQPGHDSSAAAAASAALAGRVPTRTGHTLCRQELAISPVAVQPRKVQYCKFQSWSISGKGLNQNAGQ
jgi:hypothetical protein